MTIDLTGPFRGSAAVATGVVAWGVLRGPRFRRLFPDVYAPAGLRPTLGLRSRAAAVLVAGKAVVAGWSAAELLDASCGPADAPAEVLLLEPGRQSYRCPGLRVHRDLVEHADLTQVQGCAVTTPARTASDLARWTPDLTARVVAVDALAHRHRFGQAAELEFKRRRPGAAGSRGLAEVLRLADPAAESPMETRIRMALVLAGLPAPAVQHEVRIGCASYRLDLAYPEVEVAVEYDGDHHRSQRRAHRDLAREAALTAAGWLIIRLDAHTVLEWPHCIPLQVRAELQRRGMSV